MKVEVIEYTIGENKFYDFDTMMRIIHTNKSKLHREIKRNEILRNNCIKYKNQYLYSQTSLFSLLEGFLKERLKKEFNEEWT